MRRVLSKNLLSTATLNVQHANGSLAQTLAAHQVALMTARSKICRVSLKSCSTSTRKCKTKRPKRNHPQKTKRRVRRVHLHRHHQDPRLRVEVGHHLHHHPSDRENPKTKSVKDRNLRQVVHLSLLCPNLCSTVIKRDLL